MSDFSFCPKCKNPFALCICKGEEVENKFEVRVLEEMGGTNWVTADDWENLHKGFCKVLELNQKQQLIIGELKAKADKLAEALSEIYYSMAGNIRPTQKEFENAGKALAEYRGNSD